MAQNAHPVFAEELLWVTFGRRHFGGRPCHRSEIAGLHPDTGDRLWSMRTAGRIAGAVAVGDGTIFSMVDDSAAEDGRPPVPRRLLAVGIATRRPRWTRSLPSAGVGMTHPPGGQVSARSLRAPADRAGIREAMAGRGVHPHYLAHGDRISAEIGWNGGMSEPPSMTSFLVTRVRDHSYRDGLLVSGRTLTGKIEPGMTLSDRTGLQTLVIQLEFLSPRDVRLGEVTFLVERTTPSPAQQDAVLTGISITDTVTVRCDNCGGSDLRVTRARSRLPNVDPGWIDCHCDSCGENSTVWI